MLGKRRAGADGGAGLGGRPADDRAPIDTVIGPVDRARHLVRTPELGLTALRIVREAAPRTLTAVVLMQAVSAALVGVQLLVGKILLTGLIELARAHHPSVSDVAPAFAGLLAATAASNLLGAAIQHQQRLLSEIVARVTFDRVVDVASTVELARFEDPAFYDQLQRATAASSYRPVEMVNSLMALVLGVLTSAGVVVALAALEPLLLPLIALAGLPVLAATLHNSRQAYAFEYGMTTHARERLHLAGLLTGRGPAKELRVFAATGYLRRRYDALSDERIARMREFLRGRLRVSLVASIGNALGTAIVLASLTWLIATDRIDIATAATAAVATQVLASRLNAVSGAVGKLVESGLFLDDLRSFLTLNPREAATGARSGRALRAPRVPLDELRVEGLNFSYPNTHRPVLHDVSLEVRRGEVVALVGENGSGKTTLVKLLCHLYDADAGRILWNREDVRELDPERLRAEMTVLFQDFVQYDLTIADNIALGRSDVPVDRGQLEAAARRADLHDAITALPHGYESRLGRRFLGGEELSGGQWQRLALARAFYRGGGFLVMDEPTAALDPRAEYRLFEQMRALAAGKSVLLISHRFANVRMADRIYVLDGGRVVESGDHPGLLAQDGLYAELFRLQASGYVTRPG
jgi:ATP-binding cassette, subfamily B, bacterial